MVRARIRAVPDEGGTPSTPPDGGQTARPRIRPWRHWIAIGAAASIAALLFLTRPETRPSGAAFTPSEAAHAMVDAPVGHNVAVIQTDNPDITVLWFF